MFRKLYVVVTLVFVILCILFYLILSGSTDRIREISGIEPVPSSTPVISDEPEPSPSLEPTETPEITASPETTPTPTPTPEADLTTNSSLTKIVSRTYKIDPFYVPENLIAPDVPAIDDENQNLLRADAAHALEDMFAAASEEGYSLYLISGYRSYEFQQLLWDYWVNKKGEDYAAELDAYPGASEHQTGLAANIGSLDHKCELNVCFADTQAYKWLKDHSWEYGYIERYPENKQSITGITWSPWNFRYVGKEEAEKIYRSGLTMEEYYGLAS